MDLESLSSKQTPHRFPQISNPNVLPISSTYSLNFSSLSNLLAVADGAAPFVLIYKYENDIFTKLDDPDEIPSDSVLSINFSKDDNYLAAISYSSPFVFIYLKNKNLFKKINNIEYFPSDIAIGCDFSQTKLAVAGSVNPRVIIYKIPNIPVLKISGT